MNRMTFRTRAERRILFPTSLAILVFGLAAIPLACLGQTTAPAPAATVQPAAPALPPDITGRVEQHNKELHDQLAITPQQQPQWDRFAQVTMANAGDIEQAFDARGAKLDGMNAAENMRSYAQVAQVHATNMKRAADSFEALYTTFSPSQKEAADRLFRERLAKGAVGPKHGG